MTAVRPSDHPSDLSLPIVRAIAEYTYDWESWIGPDGRLRWVNGAVERIAGYSVADCLGMKDYPLPMVHGDDRARIEALLRAAREGSEGNDVEFRIVRKGAGLRWVAVSWQPIVGAASEVLGFRASIRDIDERKAMEVSLRALRERAERADRAKTELLAHVSHELRTPADCVVGFAELLLEAGLEAPLAHYAEIIHSKGTLLLRQVEDLLDMASLESGGIRLEHRAVDVHELARRWVSALEPEARRASAKLTVAIEPSAPRTCLGDELRLSQLLRNLVENAIRHAGGGPIEVRLAAPMVDGEVTEGLLLSVRDEGVGIPADRLSAITRPFVQVDGPSARRRGGTGLGLSICDRLVRAMGGTLTIESELHVGTSVSVFLPLEVAADAILAQAGRVEAPDRTFASRFPLSVLVVDDVPESQELLAEQLVRLGYEPSRAGSGREALALVERDWPDLILLDLEMPEMNGVTVARRVLSMWRAHPERPRPRLVAITASAFAAAPDSAAAGAFDTLLVKPIIRSRLASLFATLALEGEPEAAPGSESLLDGAVVEDLLVSSGDRAETMLSRYLGRTESALPALLAAIRAHMRDDPTEAAHAAHQALGLLLSIGARGAAEHARELVDALGERGAGAAATEDEDRGASAAATEREERGALSAAATDTTRLEAILAALEVRWDATRRLLRREAGRPSG
jgi:PAS domain S-box-containing protein